jgi:hypothetical protein
MAPVRVIAVTQSDPFFTGRFFETFLEAAAPAVELVEIVVLPNFNESRTALLRRLERFYGPRDLVRLVARYLRARLDDRRGIACSVEAVAARHGIPTIVATSPSWPTVTSTSCFRWPRPRSSEPTRCAQLHGS